MSTIRDYLETKAAEHPKEWLRRKPCTTHPDILALVREFESAGGTYDDAAERFVEERAGDLPEHHHHGHEDRHALTYQLGHEVYLARLILDDEAHAEHLAALQAEGFALLDDVEIEAGSHYVLRLGVTYSGHEVPSFGEPHEVQAVRDATGWIFLPKGARTRGFKAHGPALIKAAA